LNAKFGFNEFPPHIGSAKIAATRKTAPIAGAEHAFKHRRNKIDTLAKIQALMQKELGLDELQVAPEQPLAELGIDSLSMIEFMFTLEEEFNCELPQEDEHLQTVADIVRIVDEAVAKSKK
jgi:acyl carrier protein